MPSTVTVHYPFHQVYEECEQPIGPPSFRRRGVVYSLEYPTPRSGLQAIANGEIDASVFDVAVLKNLTTNEFPGRVCVLPDSFEYYYVSMRVRNDSPLREQLNRAMLRIMATDAWSRLLERHISESR